MVTRPHKMDPPPFLSGLPLDLRQVVFHITEAAHAGGIVPPAVTAERFYPDGNVMDCCALPGQGNLIVDLFPCPSKTIADGAGIFRLLDPDPDLQIFLFDILAGIVVEVNDRTVRRVTE